MPFEFEKTKIEEVVLVKPKVFSDERGFFLETYKKDVFFNAGIKDDFIQDNHSKSINKVIRGLHYQRMPDVQSKLVRCTKGCIFDVAVDIRKNSRTFLGWVGYKLSAGNKYQLYIPKGFAHGFLVLSDEAEISYKVSGRYNQNLEGTIAWNDKDIGINWEIDFEPILSKKDKTAPKISELREGDLL